jgi:hypothetical protein
MQLLFFKFYLYWSVKFDSLSCWFTSIYLWLSYGIYDWNQRSYFTYDECHVCTHKHLLTLICDFFSLYWILCFVGSRSFFTTFSEWYFKFELSSRLWCLISAISWRSVLLVEEEGASREDHRPAARKQTNFTTYAVSSTPHNDRDSNSQR